MKTAISLPDPVFHRVERLARHLRKSRSQLYREALVEYVARHSPDEMTEAMDRVCEKMGPASDPFVREAARRALKKTEW